MKHLKLAAILFLSAPLSALAHIQVGTYAGQTPTGTACQVQVKSVVFENNLRHPLNERVTIEYLGAEHTLSHPPVVNESAATVLFDHDQLRAVLPVRGGARAVVLKMEHTEENDGPSELLFLEHDYRSPNSGIRTPACRGLRPAAAGSDRL